MYIVGTSTGNNSFSLIYAVFDKKINLDNWNVKFGIAINKPIIIVEEKNINFTFFIIEEPGNEYHSYKPINKQELQNKILGLTKANDFSTIYFNLWRIKQDTFNTNFPSEPCLNGRDYHIHFTNHDLMKIDAEGIDEYWNKILVI